MVENDNDNDLINSENEAMKFDKSGEETDLDFSLNDPSRFSQAVVWGTDWTTETIASQLEKGNIDLNPSFQRRDAWTDKEKSKFIESLALGIPVPPIILAEKKDKRNSYIVIDGKQRLLSIRRFFSKVTLKNLRDNNQNDTENFLQLKLTGLVEAEVLNGLTCETIKIDQNDFYTNIENQSIRTIVIKNWPDEDFLYTVFLRLNTGSKKLSPQELRQALHPGDFLNFLDLATSESNVMKKMLKNKSADSRMKDIELSLRYYAYKYSINDYNGNLKDFLDTTCKLLNGQWLEKENSFKNEYKDLELAIEAMFNIMETKNPFSRYNKGTSNERFNRSIFEITTYYLSVGAIRNAVLKAPLEFKKAFIVMNEDIEFIDSVDTTTKEISRVVKRFTKMFDLLNRLTNIANKKIQIPKFELNDKGKINILFIES